MNKDYRELRLIKQYGEVLSVSDIAKVFRYPSTAAVRIANKEGKLPVKLSQFPGRRGWFASATAVSKAITMLDLAASE